MPRATIAIAFFAIVGCGDPNLIQLTGNDLEQSGETPPGLNLSTSAENAAHGNDDMVHAGYSGPVCDQAYVTPSEQDKQIVFAVDASLNMAGYRWSWLTSVFQSLATSGATVFPDLGLDYFPGSAGGGTVNSSLPLPPENTDFEDLLSVLTTIQPAYNCNGLQALTAFDNTRYSDGFIKNGFGSYLVLLVGGDPVDAMDDDLKQAAQDLRDRGLRPTVIGVDFNGGLWHEVAQKSGMLPPFDGVVGAYDAAALETTVIDFVDTVSACHVDLGRPNLNANPSDVTITLYGEQLQYNLDCASGDTGWTWLETLGDYRVVRICEDTCFQLMEDTNAELDVEWGCVLRSRELSEQGV